MVVKALTGELLGRSELEIVTSQCDITVKQSLYEQSKQL